MTCSLEKSLEENYLKKKSKSRIFRLPSCSHVIRDLPLRIKTIVCYAERQNDELSSIQRSDWSLLQQSNLALDQQYNHETFISGLPHFRYQRKTQSSSNTDNLLHPPSSPREISRRQSEVPATSESLRRSSVDSPKTPSAKPR